MSYAQWQAQHRDIFGATDYDLVHYVQLPGRLGLDHRERDHAVHPHFIDLDGPGRSCRAPPGPTAGGLSDFWQRECGILGEMGPDQGRGGKHLIVPPGTAVPCGR